MTNINKEIQKELIDINFDPEPIDLEKLSEILAVSTIISQHDRPRRYAYSFNRACKIRESDNGSSWQKWRVIV